MIPCDFPWSLTFFHNLPCSRTRVAGSAWTPAIRRTAPNHSQFRLLARAIWGVFPCRNVLLDSNGGPNHLGNTCDAPLIADARYETVHRHPQYYYLGHFSRFVPRGSRRVAMQTVVAGDTPPERADEAPDGSVYNLTGSVAYGECPRGPPRAVALRRPGDSAIVVVILNCDEDAATVRIELPVLVGGTARAVQRTIPAHAIQTYVLRVS